jgi:hypothetical protein
MEFEVYLLTIFSYLLSVSTLVQELSDEILQHHKNFVILIESLVNFMK